MNNLTTKQIERRATTIMRAVRVGQVSPSSDAIAELADLTARLADEPAKPIVVARMTITRANGQRLIVEVEAGSTYSSFFKFYRQDGGRRSTKTLIRTGSRQEGGKIRPSLDAIAQRIVLVQWQANPVVDVKVRIIQRRAYRRLITARPDELGLTQMAHLPVYSPFASRSS